MKNYDDFRISQTDYDLKFTFLNQTVSFFKIMPFLNSLFSSFTEKAASKSSIFIYENEFPIVCEPKIAKHDHSWVIRVLILHYILFGICLI